MTAEEHCTNSWVFLTAKASCVILVSFSLVFLALVWIVVVVSVPVLRVPADPIDNDSHHSSI